MTQPSSEAVEQARKWLDEAGVNVVALGKYVPTLHKAAKVLAGKKEMKLATQLRELAAKLKLSGVRRAQRPDGWELAHELMECGHPRACYQDRNYPASEANYDPISKTSDPPVDYRCIACEELTKAKSGPLERASNV